MATIGTIDQPEDFVRKQQSIEAGNYILRLIRSKLTVNRAPNQHMGNA